MRQHRHQGHGQYAGHLRQVPFVYKQGVTLKQAVRNGQIKRFINIPDTLSAFPEQKGDDRQKQTEKQGDLKGLLFGVAADEGNHAEPLFRSALWRWVS